MTLEGGMMTTSFKTYQAEGHTIQGHLYNLVLLINIPSRVNISKFKRSNLYAFLWLSVHTASNS